MFDLKITTTVGNKILDVPNVLRAIQTAQNLYAGQVVKRGQHYPPERPNQKYERTYKLRGSWHVIPSHRSGDRQVVDITNDATDTKRKRPRQYANYVFGKDDAGSGQSVWHVGRWPTKGALADRESYRQQMQNAVNKATNPQ